MITDTNRLLPYTSPTALIDEWGNLLQDKFANLKSFKDHWRMMITGVGIETVLVTPYIIGMDFGIGESIAKIAFLKHGEDGIVLSYDAERSAKIYGSLIGLEWDGSLLKTDLKRIEKGLKATAIPTITVEDFVDKRETAPFTSKHRNNSQRSKRKHKSLKCYKQPKRRK